MILFDSFWNNVAFGFLAIVVLVLSANYVVDKLIRIAHHFGVSNTFIGLTVLSIGTSLPEIGSHLVASFGILAGHMDYRIASATVVGANIGSDVVQQTLILGVAILIIGTVHFPKSFLQTSYSLLIVTTLLVLGLGWDGQISRIDGAILLGLFGVYLFYLYISEPKEEISEEERKVHVIKEILLTCAGLLVLLFSSIITLDVTEYVVLKTGVGGSLIGVLTLGVASALPELFTAIISARKKATGLAVGTLIGSNIVNPLFGIGLGGLISSYYVPYPILFWDLPMKAISAVILLVWILSHQKKLNRWGAFMLILMYVVYVAVRIAYFPFD
ncbi:sodium:calcium antiporter [Candidatus Woesearchaeota archaeon]|nr:sodium:calcium antiporter [Candidatus Woesearchaeota archaeon]